MVQVISEQVSQVLFVYLLLFFHKKQSTWFKRFLKIADEWSQLTLFLLELFNILDSNHNYREESENQNRIFLFRA